MKHTRVKNSKKNSRKTMSTIHFGHVLFPLFLVINHTALAEISTLSSEELTDTYIQDTTVIVRQQKEKQPTQSIPVKLKVTPLEKATQMLPEDQTGSMSSISHELATYDDLNNQRALDSNLTPPLPNSTTEFLKGPLPESVLNQVRQAYGISAGEAVDLTALPFLTNLTPTNPGEIPAGSSYKTTESSFTITIPNLGNFNTQQIASPNGEIGVNVTPSHIEYTLNLPK